MIFEGIPAPFLPALPITKIQSNLYLTELEWFNLTQAIGDTEKAVYAHSVVVLAV